MTNIKTMQGQHTTKVLGSKIPFKQMLCKILPGKSVEAAWRFCDDGEGELVRYNVYKLQADGEFYVMKRSEAAEIFVYEHLLEGKGFPVPEYYGSTEWNGEKWILLEFLAGTDLRHFTEEMAHGCAKSVTTIMNACWQDTEEEFQQNRLDDRFDRYWTRINKRARCLENYPLLREAYQMFLDRQLTCPRTLCNGDFLPYNGIFCDGKVFMIDWAFAGIMPYSLDIARLIAHGTEKYLPFPFYINSACKEIYVREVYEQLERKPAWDRYLMDIKLALLNEYIEFIEDELLELPEEQGMEFYDPGGLYYHTEARRLAEELTGRHGASVHSI